MFIPMHNTDAAAAAAASVIAAPPVGFGRLPLLHSVCGAEAIEAHHVHHHPPSRAKQRPQRHRSPTTLVATGVAVSRTRVRIGIVVTAVIVTVTRLVPIGGHRTLSTRCRASGTRSFKVNSQPHWTALWRSLPAVSGGGGSSSGSSRSSVSRNRRLAVGVAVAVAAPANVDDRRQVPDGK